MGVPLELLGVLGLVALISFSSVLLPGPVFAAAVAKEYEGCLAESPWGTA